VSAIYLVVNEEPPNKIEIETPCHMILIEWEERYGEVLCLTVATSYKRVHRKSTATNRRGEVARNGASQAVMQAISFLFPTI